MGRLRHLNSYGHCQLVQNQAGPGREGKRELCPSCAPHPGPHPSFLCNCLWYSVSSSLKSQPPAPPHHLRAPSSTFKSVNLGISGPDRSGAAMLPVAWPPRLRTTQCCSAPGEPRRPPARWKHRLNTTGLWAAGPGDENVEKHAQSQWPASSILAGCVQASSMQGPRLREAGERAKGPHGVPLASSGAGIQALAPSLTRRSSVSAGTGERG